MISTEQMQSLPANVRDYINLLEMQNYELTYRVEGKDNDRSSSNWPQRTAHAI